MSIPLAATEKGTIQELELSTSTVIDEPAATTLEKSALPSIPDGLDLTFNANQTLLLLTFSAKPKHPQDSLCRTVPSKFLTTLIAALLVMISAIASSCSSGAATYIQRDLGGNSVLPLSMYLFGYAVGPFMMAPLSETFGRRKVFIAGSIGFTAFMGATGGSPNYASILIFRFLAGVTGAVPQTNSGAVCGDIWDSSQRGTAMAFYSVATFAGPALGPVIASFAAVRFSWPWAFWIPTIISSFLLIVTILFLPETYPPVILSKLASKLRLETGDDRIVSALEVSAMEAKSKQKVERIKAELFRLFAMPFILLFTEVIVSLLTLYMAFLYGLIYLTFEAYPVIFSEIHQLPDGYSSLPFLSTFVGAIISVPLTLWYQKRYLNSTKLRPSTPEDRLPPAQLGGILIVVSFLWLGWSGEFKRVHWIVPTLSGIVQGIGSVLIFRSLQTYLIDAYEKYSASALASNVVARSIFGGVFPLFAPVMFTRLGPGWSCTILAGGMAVLVPVPFVFQRYGARIRARSNFAPGR